MRLFLCVNQHQFSYSHVRASGKDCVCNKNSHTQSSTQRCVCVYAAQVPGKGQAALLMWLPVDRSFESGDKSGADVTAWDAAIWVPLGQALRAMRPLGHSDYRLVPSAVSQLAALEEWLADNHTIAEVVGMLWTAAAAARIRNVARNPLHALQKRATEARQPIVVLSNPLYRTDLIIPKPGTNFLLDVADTSLDTDDDKHVRGSALTPEEIAALIDAERQLASVVDDGGPGSIMTHGAWSQRYPVHKAAMEGDANRVKEYIHAMYPPAEHDNDSWTPLHYAAWHGREAVVRTLMADWQGKPTARK